MPPEHHLKAQAWTGEVLSVPAGSGAKERRDEKFAAPMQAQDWVHGFPQFKLQGIKN